MEVCVWGGRGGGMHPQNLCTITTTAAVTTTYDRTFTPHVSVVCVGRGEIDTDAGRLKREAE